LFNSRREESITPTVAEAIQEYITERLPLERLIAKNPNFPYLFPAHNEQSPIDSERQQKIGFESKWWTLTNKINLSSRRSFTTDKDHMAINLNAQKTLVRRRLSSKLAAIEGISYPGQPIPEALG